MPYQSVTLKVCEGCGTLWVRRGAAKAVYCRPCTGILEQFPDPTTRLRPGRPKKSAAGHAATLPAFSLAGGAL